MLSATSTVADADTLTRLRVLVEAGRPVPNDFARRLLNILQATADSADRRYMRDHHIRRAGLLFKGSPWERAMALAKETSALDRAWERLHDQAPEAMTVRGELHAAKLLHKLPGSTRQFYNIISR